MTAPSLLLRVYFGTAIAMTWGERVHDQGVLANSEGMTTHFESMGVTMLTKVFRSLVIAAIFAAMGCSNQAPNHSESGGNKLIDSYPSKPTTVHSQVVLDDSRQIGTTLSDRKVKSDGSEVSFHVKTDSPIEGRTEFVMALFGSDLGNGRYSAGYRVEDLKGRELWRSEYAAQTSDMTWVQMKKSNSKHSWSYTQSFGTDVIVQTHMIDGRSLTVETPDHDFSTVGKATAYEQVSSVKLSTIYDGSESLFGNQYEEHVLHILNDASLLPWISGEPTDEMANDGPQEIDLGGWLALACKGIEAVSPDLCAEGSGTYDAKLCKASKLALLACEAMNILGLIHYK